MDKKVILVTGVSSGIGAATMEVLTRAGHTVFGGARSPRKLAVMPGEIVPLDVRDDASVQACVDTVLRKAGRIDVVVNNAGVSLVGPVEATSIEEAQALFDTNVFGVLRMSRAALPAMRKQGSGLIVNMSSVLGFLPAPFMGLYSSSKHALEGLSESLDHEVRDFGIRVVLIEPSFTRTKLDTNAAQTRAEIGDYANALARMTKAVHKQVQDAPEPRLVAEKISAVIQGAHRMRQTADGRAKLLSVLRRFAPSKQVDKSLRQAFGL